MKQTKYVSVQHPKLFVPKEVIIKSNKRKAKAEIYYKYCTYRSYHTPVVIPLQSHDMLPPMLVSVVKDHDEDVVIVHHYPVIVILPC
jgi:hypothetical protein